MRFDSKGILYSSGKRARVNTLAGFQRCREVSSSLNPTQYRFGRGLSSQCWIGLFWRC